MGGGGSVLYSDVEPKIALILEPYEKMSKSYYEKVKFNILRVVNTIKCTKQGIMASTRWINIKWILKEMLLSLSLTLLTSTTNFLTWRKGTRGIKFGGIYSGTVGAVQYER